MSWQGCDRKEIEEMILPSQGLQFPWGYTGLHKFKLQWTNMASDLMDPAHAEQQRDMTKG